MSGRIRVRGLETFLSQGVRAKQEDFVSADRDRKIFCVADGFGVGQAGVQSAQTACRSVERFLYKEAGDLEATLPFILRPYFSLAGNVLFNSLIFANRECRKLNLGKSAQTSGGTSFLAGFVDQDLLVLGAVGGCEAWLLRQGRWVPLTQPRTYGALLDPSQPSRPGIEQVPLRALGMADDLEPEIVELRLLPGDGLLLHTDGWGGAERLAWSEGLGRGVEPTALLRTLFLTEKVDNSAGVWALFDK